MRKRAQRKSIPVEEKTTQTFRKEPEQPKKVTGHLRSRNWWTIAILVGIFCTVLLMNSFFQADSGYAYNENGETVSERYYLSGPDPYYNMRLVEQTLETGGYQFYSDRDPLLDYPLTHTGQRAPLLNMMAIGFSRLLVPMMDPIDATGFAMQFVPALFGALLIFPVYFIGKTVFGRKEGLIAALFISFIPIHLGSGHGSSFALFDHDSFNLLLFFITFAFLIKAIREVDRYKMILYSLLAGVGVAGLTMVWVEAQFLYVIIAVYAIVQMIFDLFTNKIDLRSAVAPSLVLLSGYLFSFPVQMSKYRFWNNFPDLRLMLIIGVMVFSVIYLLLNKRRIPWTISLPVLFSIAGAALVFLYFINVIAQAIPAFASLTKIAEIIYGEGIYGSKVSLTIAEAGTYGISRTWMSYNPMIFLLALVGAGLLIFFYFKPTPKTSKMYKRRDYLFLIVLFAINLWLTSTAGRFLNDFVPIVAIVASWVLWMGIKRFDFKSMIKNIKNAGGGIRGLRKGVSIYQLIGILLLAGMFLVPKVGLAHLAFDAAIPSHSTQNGTSNLITDYFGDDYGGAFSSGVYTEVYWVDAFSWLNDQDLNIEDPIDRPAVISWWDYGFYEVAVGGHPTVADNFQDGIPPASNFHTAQNESEAVAIWCIRLIEGAIFRNDKELKEPVQNVLIDHLGNENGTLLYNIVRNPQEYAPSYDTFISEEYGNDELRVRAENARYHDGINLILTLPEDDITWFYHDLQDTTGFSIRYYAVEGYDLNIFNVFSFLSDKGTHGYATAEDDFFKTTYIDGQGNSHTAQELENMSQAEIQAIGGIVDQRTERKDAFFNSMVYQTYLGPINKETFNQYGRNGNELLQRGYAPTAGMKHFAVKYLSPLGYARGGAPLATGCPAVIISKYYAGAYLNGTISINGTPAQFVQAVIYDEFGIPHDNLLSDENGNFKLLATGGNITLRLSYANQVILKEITFNTTEHPPISDDEAMRRVDDYTRELNISISMSSVDGYVYEDIDGDGIFDEGTDMPLSDIVIEMVDEFGLHANPEPMTTDENGYYSFTDIFPSKYTVTALEDGFELYSESLNIEPGSRTINISKPKLAGLEGTVYFDENNNEVLTPGEEMSSVTVNLIYGRTEEVVDTQVTDASGTYSFTQLIPGDYLINATKNSIETGYPEYFVEDEITLEPNQTAQTNLSIGYAPVTVSGITQANGNAVGNILVNFDEAAIENNTAQAAESTSNVDGTYQTELIPGTYDVVVDVKDDDIGTYSFTDTLTLTPGQGIYTYTIDMEKHSVSVDGVTTYSGQPVGELTVFFKPSAGVNNTAQAASTSTDENGEYHLELMPGSYNVNISQTINESGMNARYTFAGSVMVALEDDPLTYNIVLTRFEL